MGVGSDKRKARREGPRTAGPVHPLQTDQQLGERELLAPGPGDSQRLLHELRVHQTELEQQNEELRSTRSELEQSLARYTQIFDLAPIGYATLRWDETIAEVNHAGAALLGVSRRDL